MTDQQPGIRRLLRGTLFCYRDAQGRAVVSAEILARIRQLAIPPAWTGVWICPSPQGHIQATGRDARGRKQYRYHLDWRETRDGAKFERTLAFGRVLPRIRRQVLRDLSRRDLDRRKVLAAVVRLLETTLIRVGNEEYARSNHSFGLSTLQDRHVKIAAGTLHFQFVGKSGKHHQIDLHDVRLARIVRRAQDLPGQDLFQYQDAAGRPQKIDSGMVNDYLRELAGAEFSAKDFRTWAGTVLMAVALGELAHFGSAAEAKRNLLGAVERVAQRLGNTPTICRKCYIHPVIMQSYLDGRTIEVVRQEAERELMGSSGRLSQLEAAVLTFLETHWRPRRGPSGSLA